MLFNSYDFLFLFLPATFLAFLIVNWLAPRFNALILVVASILFYGYWNISFVPLLLVSIGANFLISKRIQRRGMLALGIVFNLSLLVYFKYTLFAAGLFGLSEVAQDIVGTIVLPLGISFYTFHQISYLVDLRRRSVTPPDFITYAAYIVLFPQLIAGPIVRYHQIDRQLVRLQRGHSGRRLAILASSGLALFAFGLFKKVVLADSLGLIANPIFGHGANGISLSSGDAWLGALAYSFQLYFDFSGYSDMALGLARMFGLFFPVNFYSPYKSTSIRQFWRRWHMSLSYFVRDYIYVPLGGSRLGSTRHAVNLLLCFIIIGVWHGAGFTFLFWGIYHGLLVTNSQRLERLVKLGISVLRLGGGVVEHTVLMLGTFLLVALGWVLFRAHSLQDALTFYRSIVTLRDGPDVFVEAASYPSAIALVAFSAIVCFYFPNTIELLGSRWHALLQGLILPPRRRYAARNVRQVAIPIAAGLALYLAVSSIRGFDTTFLYFNF